MNTDAILWLLIAAVWAAIVIVYPWPKGGRSYHPRRDRHDDTH